VPRTFTLTVANPLSLLPPAIAADGRTPTVVATAAGEQLVTNASGFIPGYDPRKAARPQLEHHGA
jgi:hypothetical protein